MLGDLKYKVIIEHKGTVLAEEVLDANDDVLHYYFSPPNGLAHPQPGLSIYGSTFPSLRLNRLSGGAWVMLLILN